MVGYDGLGETEFGFGHGGRAQVFSCFIPSDRELRGKGGECKVLVEWRLG